MRLRITIPVIFLIVFLISPVCFAQDSVLSSESCDCRIDVWGEIIPGNTIMLSASPCKKHIFLRWEDIKSSDPRKTDLPIDLNSHTVTFVIPDYGMTLSAVFVVPHFYKVNACVDPYDAGRILINDSSGFGKYFRSGEIVKLSFESYNLFFMQEDLCFIGWHSDDIHIEKPHNPEISIEIQDSHINITAVFGYIATVKAIPEEGGQVFIKAERSCFKFREEYDIYALPEDGYDFIYWKVESSSPAEIISNIQPETTVTMPNSRVTITGYFSREYPDFQQNSR